MGGSLDQSPIAYHAFEGSKVERGHFRHQKLRSAESQGMSVGTWQSLKVGPAGLIGVHASPREGSQHSVDFSRLGDSRDKSMRAQPFGL
jgi:hypothetical protein